MHHGLAGAALVHALLGSLVANCADSLVVPRLDLQTMSLHPACTFGVVNGLSRGLRDNRRRGHRRLGIYRRCIGRSRVLIRVQGCDRQVGRMAQERRTGPPGNIRLDIHSKRRAAPGGSIKMTGSLLSQRCLKSQTRVVTRPRWWREMSRRGRGICSWGGRRPCLRRGARPGPFRSGRVASRQHLLLASLQIGIEDGRLIHVRGNRTLAKGT